MSAQERSGPGLLAGLPRAWPGAGVHTPSEATAALNVPPISTLKTAPLTAPQPSLRNVAQDQAQTQTQSQTQSDVATCALPPTLGVMGGGQLGRMFVHAAQTLGFRTVVLDPDAASPAGLVAHAQVCTAYDSPAGLQSLAAQCHAVTTEFENVPAESMAALAQHCAVAPHAQALAVCQHRVLEKRHIAACGVPCAPFAVLEQAADLAAVPVDLFPAILKSSTLGYDGKGQIAVARHADLALAWSALDHAPCVLEQRLDLALEFSVIVARGWRGEVVHLPPQQNLHRDGILALTQVPAPGVSSALALQAVDAATAIAKSLGFVGVLCVEFFVLRDGRLVANEMAPRPHNSGHYSLDACDLSQFDLQVRALAGLPLRAPRQHSAAVMLNLLGDLWCLGSDAAAPQQEPDWAPVLALPGAHLHLYGKGNARKGRKMGHLTLTAASADEAWRTAMQAAALLGIAAFEPLACLAALSSGAPQRPVATGAPMAPLA